MIGHFGRCAEHRLHAVAKEFDDDPTMFFDRVADAVEIGVEQRREDVWVG